MLRFGLLSKWPCHVEFTSSNSKTEIKVHWARTVLEWETALELPGVAGICSDSDAIKRRVYSAKSASGRAPPSNLANTSGQQTRIFCSMHPSTTGKSTVDQMTFGQMTWRHC